MMIRAERNARAGRNNNDFLILLLTLRCASCAYWLMYSSISRSLIWDIDAADRGIRKEYCPLRINIKRRGGNMSVFRKLKSLMNWIPRFVEAEFHSSRRVGLRSQATLRLEVLEDRTVPAQLFASFEGSGIYYYNNNSEVGNTGWFPLTSSTPAAMAGTSTNGSGNPSVVASFQGAGTWLWTSNSGWRELTPAPASALAIDGNEIAGDWSGSGVYLYNLGTGSWSHLTTTDASQLAVNSQGDVVGAFPGAGVWYCNTANWMELTSSSANLVALDYSGDVIASFPGAGVWIYGNPSASYGWGYVSYSPGWHQLTTLSAEALTMMDNGTAAISFAGAGTWMNSDGQWQEIANGYTSQIAFDSVGDVVFGATGGVYLHNALTLTTTSGGSNAWTQLTSSAPQLVGG